MANRKIIFRTISEVIYAVDQDDHLLAKMWRNRDGTFVVSTVEKEVIRTMDFGEAKGEFKKLVMGEE